MAFYQKLGLIFIFLGIIYVLGSALRYIRLNLKLKKILVGNQVLWVKIAQTDKDKQQGLSGVKSLAENEGMLFILPEKQIPYFWMKEMHFPLDFIWIAESYVVDLTENLPPSVPSAPDDKIPGCSPKEPIDMILEINAGFVKNHGIKIGDVLQIENK